MVVVVVVEVVYDTEVEGRVYAGSNLVVETGEDSVDSRWFIDSTASPPLPMVDRLPPVDVALTFALELEVGSSSFGASDGSLLAEEDWLSA